jgi:hypothetical protein
MSGVAGLTTKEVPMSRPQPLQPRNAPIYDGCATRLLPQAAFPPISGVSAHGNLQLQCNPMVHSESLFSTGIWNSCV